MKNPFLVIFALVLLFGCMPNEMKSQTRTTASPNKTSTSKDTEKKIDELIAKMTLEEKIGQLIQYNGSWDVTGPAPAGGGDKAKYEHLKNGRVGSMLNVVSVKATREAQELAMSSRLKIPLIFGYDVIHGYQTMFPVPLGESASWDMDAIKQSAQIAAAESAASGIHWTFAPMVDVSRDARWGRVMEGAGEDTYLGSKIATARVMGFQGDDLSTDNTIAACAKHFAAYGFAEAGRDYNTVDISERTLREVVFPPFQACVDAGVATFMNSFNEIGGVPATGSKFLQRDILKGEWGFDGFIVSDWGSIAEMIPHGVAKDKRDAAKIAMNAGSDMDMEGYCYIDELQGLVDAGEVDLAKVEDAVRRVLRVKFRLGLFDDPYKYCDEAKEKAVVGAKEHLVAARDIARKSIVLLKNDNNILPLKKAGQTIAVIGPLAADKDAPLGSWRAHAVANSAISVLEGIKNAVSDVNNVRYAEGAKLSIGKRNFLNEVTINMTDKSGFAEAEKMAAAADIVVLAIGEDAWQSGEGRSQVDIGLTGVQQELLEKIVAANKNTVVVLMNGRPLALPWMDENVPAIVETWQLGSEAGNAIADVLFGDYNPSGKLPVSFPRHGGQTPLYYNQKNTGRPSSGPGMVFWSHYTDERNDALYPFGYGLSYTTFSYSDLKLKESSVPMNGEVSISVTIKNTGKVAGKETAQLYIRDLFGSVTRPVRELKGFEQVELKPGESKTVTFTLTEKDLAFWTADKKWAAEAGDFEVYVGGSSKANLKGTFSLK
ncbi:MAG: beta-glucosidase [Paraglaciecola sp.]|jgi:beta-glucosidase